MPKIQLQFHAIPAEALTMASKWVSEHGLHAVAEYFFPDYRASWISAEALNQAAGTGDSPDRVCLTLRAAELSGVSAIEFLERNPDCLALTLGKLGTDGLRESALSAMTDDPASLDLWRWVLRGARSQMHTGATAVNPATGATVEVPRHSHTAGAHEEAMHGVKMMAAAGWIEYEFHDIH